MGIPWWAWVVIGVAALISLLVLAARSFRARIRREFIAYLAEHHPELEVTGARGRVLFIRASGEEGQWHLHKIIEDIVHLSNKEDTPERRAEVYKYYADALVEEFRDVGAPLSLSKHGDRVLPRLVRPEWLAGLPPDSDLPSRRIDDLGLVVVYVLDSAAAVRYLNATNMTELGLDADRLYELALRNLRTRFASDTVATAIRESTITMVKALDSYDAARILVVPDFLKEGEEIVALIPDRDTLTLAPVPADANWDTLRKLARIPGGEHLLINRPVHVTRAGFRVI